MARARGVRSGTSSDTPRGTGAFGTLEQRQARGQLNRAAQAYHIDPSEDNYDALWLAAEEYEESGAAPVTELETRAILLMEYVALHDDEDPSRDYGRQIDDFFEYVSKI